MATITRASLPEEFLDVTSAKLLMQPEPQYFHAQLAKAALGAALALLAGPAGISAERAIPSQGADYGDVAQDRLILNDGIYDEAVTVVPEVGKTAGHTVKMNRPKFAGGGYTQAQRAIVSGKTISTQAIDLSSEQVPITLQRFGGPFDDAQGQVAPYALDRFDSSMSIHSIIAMVGKHMKRDYDKWLDAVMVALYDLAGSVIYPGNFSADNDSMVQGDMPMDYETLTRIEESMKNGNIQPFANGQWAAVLHPRQGRQLKNDPQYNRQSQFEKSMNPIFAGFIGRVGKLDLFESNTLTTTTNGNGKTIYRAQAFGPGAVGIGMGGHTGQVGPRIAYSTDDNYGEQAKLIWLAYMAFAMLDQRFILSVRTS